MSSTATSTPHFRASHSRCCSRANQPNTPNSGEIASVPNSISCSANRPRRLNGKPSRKSVPNSRTNLPCSLRNRACSHWTRSPKQFATTTARGFWRLGSRQTRLRSSGFVGFAANTRTNDFLTLTFVENATWDRPHPELSTDRQSMLGDRKTRSLQSPSPCRSFDGGAPAGSRERLARVATAKPAREIVKEQLRSCWSPPR